MFSFKTSSDRNGKRKRDALQQISKQQVTIRDPEKRPKLQLRAKLDEPPPQSSSEEVLDDGDERITEKTVEEAEEEEAKTVGAEEQAIVDQFLEKHADLLALLLELEAQPLVDNLCGCGRGPRHYDCEDCLQYDPSCEECFIGRHRYVPFHWVHQWQTPGYYRRSDMACLLGDTFFLQLGHGGGPCPNPGNAQTVTVVHTNGIHGTRIKMCYCNGTPNAMEQFMRARLFPATLQAPKTLFTFQVLNEFQKHSLVSKQSTYDYLGALRHLTDGAFAASVQDPYKPLLRVTNIWRRLTADKWNGRAFQLYKAFPNRKPNSIVIFCPACPEHGFNTEARWELTPEQFRHLVQRLWFADGNFHLNSYDKSKRQGTHGENVSLLNCEGAGYFPPEGEMKEYLAIAPKNVEKSTCNYLKAVNNQDKKKFKNMSVSGVVAVACSHVFVLSAVDLTAGEGFIFTDKAFQHAHAHTCNNREPGHRCSCDEVFGYDCNCQYCVNMRKRFAVTCPELVPLVDRLRFVIGPLHLKDHKAECTENFSASYKESMPQVNADSIEQVWGMMNGVGAASRQMKKGLRQDVIAAHLAFLNWSKSMVIGQRLSLDIIDAREQYQIARNTFNSLSVTYHLQVPAWKRLAEERDRELAKGKKGKKKLPSLFRHNVSKSQGDKTTTKGRNLSDVAAMILEAMNIQNAQRRIKGKLTLNQTETVKKDINERRNRLSKRIKALRALQAKHMEGVEPDVVGQALCEPENERIFLPSDYTFKQRTQKNLGGLAEIEKELREGELYDAIEEVRQAAKDQSIVREQKKKNDRGTRANTRSQLQLKTIYVDLQCCINDYNGARKALQALGAGLDLPEMKEEDTYRKSTVHKRGLGDSRRTDGQLYTRNLTGSPGMEDQMRTEGPSSVEPSTTGTQVVRRKRVSMAVKRDQENKRKGQKGLKEDGWIWRPTFIFSGIGISDQDQEQYQEESKRALILIVAENAKSQHSISADRVQWFRAWAERDRWRESTEKLEADFRNCIRSFARMYEVWEDASQDTEATSRTFGHRAYAQRQAQMYHRLRTDAETAFKNLGFEVSLPEGEILADRIARIRASHEEEDARVIKKLVTEAEGERRRRRAARGWDSDDDTEDDKDEDEDEEN
ncbi:hypothetical protein V5O48_013043 [Marasmius crinis-equi]|uniref:CxC2-like cysteine cluster KDZ transposase-associated domain-containing protein n=1 Tax=Marasmius crinis-equi TaxID=585013 RepID=A0ABR3F146_9AGAR